MHKNKTSVGIDISDRTIEVAELEKSGADIKVVNLGRVKIEPGIVEHGRISDKGKLAAAVKKVLAEAKPSAIKTDEVIFGLPESQVYIHIFSADIQSGQKIDEVVAKEVLSIIPLPASDMAYSYKSRVKARDKIIGNADNNGDKEILLAAASRQVVREWENFFSKINLKVRIFDIEILAVFRGIFKELPREPVCLLDVGATMTNLAIFTSRGLVFGHTFRIAGNNFTEQIAKELKISLTEAEKLKMTKGLSSKKASGIIKKAFSPLAAEIKENIKYWQEESGAIVKEIILLGGSSRMPGLVDYFNSLELAAKTKLAEPLIKTGNLAFKYIEAVGLALRVMNSSWSRTDPCIVAAKDKESGVKTVNMMPKINKIRERVIEIVKKLRNNRVLVLVLLIIIFLALILYIVFGMNSQPASSPTAIPEQPSAVESAVPAGIRETEAGEELTSRQIIRIKDMGSSLNVRGGPGTEYKVVGKAMPISEYELLEEGEGWYKVKIATDTDGWIFAEFSEKIE